MKRCVLFILTVVLSVFIMAGIGFAGKIVTEEREVSNFNCLKFTCSGALTLIQGDKESLTIEADEDIIAMIETGVRGGTLVIGFEYSFNWKNMFGKSKIKFYLTMKDIKEIDIKGSGDIDSPKIVAEDLNLNISGSGDIEIEELAADNLDMTIQGSGDIEVEEVAVTELEGRINGSGDIYARGKATSQHISINGSGDYEASKLETENTEIKISGSGDAEVRASEFLYVKISGSGDVSYYGSPKVSIKASGSGRIRSLD